MYIVCDMIHEHMCVGLYGTKTTTQMHFRLRKQTYAAFRIETPCLLHLDITTIQRFRVYTLCSMNLLPFRALSKIAY